MTSFFDEYKAEKLKAVREKNSNLTDKQRKQTFDNFKVSAETKLMYDTALNYDGRGYLAYGNPGNGKSHLAAAVANRELEKGNQVIFINVPTLFIELKDTYNKDNDESEKKILDKLMTCKLLILDDLGSEKKSEWTEQTIYTIINARYNMDKPIIVTTNCNLSELAEKIGTRALDRLIEICTLVECKAPSYRPIIAKERMK
jgi:DNA replication protein DnaC